MNAIETGSAHPSPAPDDGCRLLTLADVEPAARVIAQAFIDDPLCAYMLPSRRSRPRTLTKFFRIYGELNIKAGRVYGAGDPLQGVAYWKFPEAGGLSISVRGLGKLLPLLFSMYTIGYIRAREILKRIEALHERHASMPHYYLDNLGVVEAARGRGLASKLIRPFLAQADQGGFAAYTDTVTEANVPMYEHLGFRCVESSPVDGTGITVWALLREVRS
jgi:ribosomal protein S18 acetylase RimI-like enzyme